MHKSSYPTMAFGSVSPLITIPVNDSFILGVYQGSISQFDMLLRYRQKLLNGRWSRIRTPKHIHWAVDMLIKLHEDKDTTNQFLDFLISYWNNHVTPIRSEGDRSELLDAVTLKAFVEKESANYHALAGKGEYSIKFLLLVAVILMHQEKTNREDAYMFKNVLASLREGKDISSIVSKASFHGRH